ncbi:MAG TPA: hypothetical protein VNN22_26100 [Verrucomicrobiae bacterium]|nr:hypothetical protein [Verrucomicrobiae bacterium]
MKLARIIRFSIIKFIRFWNPRWRDFWSELYYALEPLKKINNSNCKHGSPEHEKEKHNPVAPGADIHAIGQRPNKDGAYDQEKDTNRKIKSIGAAFFKFIELLALIAAVATAWVIYAQFQEMQRTTSAANGQLRTMEGQLDEMKQARIQDERAWIFVTIPNNALNLSVTNGSVNLIMKNIGKTPALITSEYGGITEDASAIQPHDPKGINDSLMLIPNCEGSLKVIIPLNVEARIVTGTRVYVFGTVFYSDISGDSHWSQFCFSFTENGGLMLTGNFHASCDDLETKQK